jgi:hypothetical protein
MDNWLFFLGGMTVMCGCAAILAAFSDWLQDKLDESNEEQDNEQSNNSEQ